MSMNLELDGRVVVVTGGSRGIGLACARALAQEGAVVAIVSREQSHLDAALAGLGGFGRCVGVAADLRDADAARRAIGEVEAALGPTDILVNSAGAARRYAPKDLDAQAWHAAMDAKYFTYVHAMDAVLPGMVERGRGVIVNVIGMGGKVGNPVHLPGGAANAALMLVTTGLANAYGRQGIRINGVNPSATLTDRVQLGLAVEARASGLSEAEVRARGEARIPLGRYAEPDEVARVVLFLASPLASYVTRRDPADRRRRQSGDLVSRIGSSLTYFAMLEAHPKTTKTVRGEKLAAANVENLRKASDNAARRFSLVFAQRTSDSGHEGPSSAVGAVSAGRAQCPALHEEPPARRAPRKHQVNGLDRPAVAIRRALARRPCTSW